MSNTASQWRELARTANGGASAFLLWDESSNRIRVALADERLCHYVDFEIHTEAELRAIQRPFGGVATDLTSQLGGRHE